MVHPSQQLGIYGQAAVKLVPRGGHQPHGKLSLEHQDGTPEQTRTQFKMRRGEVEVETVFKLLSRPEERPMQQKFEDKWRRNLHNRERFHLRLRVREMEAGAEPDYLVG